MFNDFDTMIQSDEIAAVQNLETQLEDSKYIYEEE